MIFTFLQEVGPRYQISPRLLNIHHFIFNLRSLTPLSTVIIWPVSDLRELETLNTKIQVMIDFKEPKLSKIEKLEVRSENR